MSSTYTIINESAIKTAIWDAVKLKANITNSTDANYSKHYYGPWVNDIMFSYNKTNFTQDAVNGLATSLDLNSIYSTSKNFNYNNTNFTLNEYLIPNANAVVNLVSEQNLSIMDYLSTEYTNTITELASGSSFSKDHTQMLDILFGYDRATKDTGDYYKSDYFEYYYTISNEINHEVYIYDSTKTRITRPLTDEDDVYIICVYIDKIDYKIVY